MLRRLVDFLVRNRRMGPARAHELPDDESRKSAQIRALLGMLRRGKRRQMEDAALKLGGMCAREAIPDLLEATGRPQGPRCQAARALGMMGATEAIPALERLLLDPETHDAAHWALMELGWRPSSAQDALAHALHAGDWDALRAEGAKAVPVLSLGAVSGETKRRIRCVELLAEAGTPEAASLVRALVHDRAGSGNELATDLRQACVVSLGQFRDPNDIALLAEIARGQTSGPAALTRLSLLKACATGLRTIDLAWGRSVDEGFVRNALGRDLGREPVELRCVWIDLIGDVPMDRVDEYCVSLLVDQEDSIRHQAAAVLRRRRWVSPSRESTAALYVAEGGYDQALALGDEAVAALQAVADPGAIDALVRMGSDAARDALMRILREGSRQQVMDVSKALQDHPELAYLRPLAMCLPETGSHSSERYEAVAAAMVEVVRTSPVEAGPTLHGIIEGAGVRARVLAGFAGHAAGVPVSEGDVSRTVADYVANPRSHSPAVSQMLLSTIGESGEFWLLADASRTDSAPKDVLERWCRLASEALSYQTVRHDRYRSDIRLAEGDDATAELCAEPSPITTAVLTEVRGMPDVKAHENTGPLGPAFSWVNYDRRREMARVELERRGAP